MEQFKEGGIVFASICLPSALLTLILSVYNETANSYGMYGWINKAQMSFQRDQQPPTHLPVNCEMNCAEQTDRMWIQYWNRKKRSPMIPGFWFHNTYGSSVRCNQQNLTGPPWLLLRSNSMTVLAASRHPVPMLHQPAVDDVKYWFACPPISPRLGFAVKFI